MASDIHNSSDYDWGSLKSDPNERPNMANEKVQRSVICEWTRAWFQSHYPATREDFDLPTMLADFHRDHAAREQELLEVLREYREAHTITCNRYNSTFGDTRCSKCKKADALLKGEAE